MSVVKVDVDRLISMLEDEKDALMNSHKKNLAKWEADSKNYNERLADALEALAKKVRSGKSIRTRYRGGELDFKLNGLPVIENKPMKPSRICEIDRQIRLLKISASPTINVDERSDLAKFICDVG